MSETKIKWYHIHLFLFMIDAFIPLQHLQKLWIVFCNISVNAKLYHSIFCSRICIWIYSNKYNFLNLFKWIWGQSYPGSTVSHGFYVFPGHSDTQSNRCTPHGQNDRYTAVHTERQHTHHSLHIQTHPQTNKYKHNKRGKHRVINIKPSFKTKPTVLLQFLEIICKCSNSNVFSHYNFNVTVKTKHCGLGTQYCKFQPNNSPIFSLFHDFS